MKIDKTMKIVVCDKCATVIWWTGDEEAEEHLCDFCMNKIDKIKDIGKQELKTEIEKVLKQNKWKEDIFIEVSRIIDKRFDANSPE